MSMVVPATGIAPTLLDAIERWDEVQSPLQRLSDQLSARTANSSEMYSVEKLAAPLPRTWQWLDGSVFKTHVELGTKAYKVPDVWHERPLMYQGMSHQFLPPIGDVAFPAVSDGIDFEGEFGVITGAVPMGATQARSAQSIILVALINDWSLRVQGKEEMRRGYGWIHAKPACTMGPVVVTPDELGNQWQDCRCWLNLHVERNGTTFGHANGGEMAFGFDELIAHAAYSRNLSAGTLIGSGTVANADYQTVGSSCILERRAIELLEQGVATTPFLADGERVRMYARRQDGFRPFGTMDSLVRVFD